MTKKHSAAVLLGRRGGKATAKNLTPEQRSENCRRAVQARWARYRAMKEMVSNELPRN